MTDEERRALLRIHEYLRQRERMAYGSLDIHIVCSDSTADPAVLNVTDLRLLINAALTKIEERV